MIVYVRSRATFRVIFRGPELNNFAPEDGDAEARTRPEETGKKSGEKKKPARRVRGEKWDKKLFRESSSGENRKLAARRRRQA